MTIIKIYDKTILLKSYLKINLLGGNVKNSVYRIVKSLRLEGYKIKYINSFVLWALFYLLVCGGIIYFIIVDEVGEFKQIEKTYSYYKNHQVELPVLPIISEILQVTTQSSDTIDAYSYYQIEIEDNLEPSARLFRLSVLEKAKTSKQWVMQSPYSGNELFIALFNKEWQMFYLIDTRVALDKEIAFLDLYFNDQIQFKDQKLSVLLTWSPNYFGICFFKSFIVLFICGVIILFIFLLIFYYIHSLIIKKYSAISYYLNDFLPEPYWIISRLDKNKRYIFIKTRNKIIYFKTD